MIENQHTYASTISTDDGAALVRLTLNAADADEGILLHAQEFSGVVSVERLRAFAADVAQVADEFELLIGP